MAIPGTVASSLLLQRHLGMRVALDMWLGGNMRGFFDFVGLIGLYSEPNPFIP